MITCKRENRCCMFWPCHLYIVNERPRPHSAARAHNAASPQGKIKMVPSVYQLSSHSVVFLNKKSFVAPSFKIYCRRNFYTVNVIGMLHWKRSNHSQCLSKNAPGNIYIFGAFFDKPDSDVFTAGPDSIWVLLSLSLFPLQHPTYVL